MAQIVKRDPTTLPSPQEERRLRYLAQAGRFAERDIERAEYIQCARRQETETLMATRRLRALTEEQWKPSH